MQAFICALSAEMLKLRRSLALTLTLLIPFAIIALEFCMVLEQGPQIGLHASETETLWQAHIGMILNWWSLLILPLFATLSTALVAGVDHTNNQWKQLYALPISRHAMYAAKMAVNLGLIAVSLLAVLAYGTLSGALFNLVFPNTPLGWQIPWRYGLRLGAILFGSSWLLVAIHTWVSMRWKSFVIPTAFGIIMTTAGIIIIQSKYGPYYPWTLPTMALLTVLGRIPDTGPSLHLLLSIAGLGSLFLWPLTSWEMTRRDVL